MDRMKRGIGLGLFGSLIVACLLLWCGSRKTAIAGQTEKTVRVGYVNYENYEEGGEGEYKRGYGYEYLQKISYLTGWKYEYVYGTFTDLMKQLENGEIDLFGNVSYTEERAEKFFFSEYPQGKEAFMIYITSQNKEITAGAIQTLNGKKIGVTENSFQKKVFENWAVEKGITCQLITYDGSNSLRAGLESGAIDAMVLTDVAATYGYVPVTNIGSSDFYFAVSKQRPDVLEELNCALAEIQTADLFYNENVYSKYNKNSSTMNAYITTEEKNWLDSHDNTVRLGYLKNNLPYSNYNLITKQPEGILTILIQALEKKGIQFECTAFDTMDDIVDAIQKKSIDLAFPMFSDYWLAEQFDVIMSESISETTMLLMFSSGFSETCTKRIAVAKDNAIQYGYVQVNFPEAKIVFFDTQQKCLEAVLSGHADSTLVTSSAYNRIRQYKETAKLSYLELPKKLDVCFHSNKENTRLVTILNKNIQVVSDQLAGFALAEYSYARTNSSLVDFIQDNAVLVTLILSVLLCIFTGFFIYYRKTASRMKLLIAEEIKHEEEIHAAKEKAQRDPMTGLLNRGAFDMLQESFSSSADIAMMIIDIDSFKNINDTYGHSMGDDVIRHVATSIRETFRTSDYVSRIGGDEFAVIMTNINPEQKEIIVKKIEILRNKLANKPDELVDVTLSIGVAIAEQETLNDAKVMFQHADLALYMVKENGRDGYAFYN